MVEVWDFTIYIVFHLFPLMALKIHAAFLIFTSDCLEKESALGSRSEPWKFNAAITFVHIVYLLLNDSLRVRFTACAPFSGACFLVYDMSE